MKQSKVENSRRHRSNTIFRKMFLSFIIVPLIPIAALMYLTEQAKHEAVIYAEENLIHTARLIQQDINSWVNNLVSSSQLISVLDDIKSMDPVKIVPVLKRLEESSEAVYIARVDNAEGWAIARSDGRRLRNYSARSYFQEAISGKTVSHDVIIGKTTGQPIICLSVPIRDQSFVQGVLNQCAKLEDVSTVVADLKVGDTGFAFLVDAQNRLIAYGGTDIDLSEQLRDMSLHEAIVDEVKNGLVQYVQANKKIAYKTQLGLDWTLVVQQDESEAYEVVESVLRNQVIAIIITAIVSLLVTLIMSRVISKPIEEARQETADILTSVNDGLFLIDSEYKIGKQHSKNLEQILQKPELAGSNFMQYLNEAVPDDVAVMAKDYISLLFEERVKEDLVQTRNPLKLVQASVENSEGQLETKYLSLTFKRVRKNGIITNLLVTAKDITKETLLKVELEKVKEEKIHQVSMLAEILHIPLDKMEAFLGESEKAFNQINTILEQPGADNHTLQKKIRDMYNIVHMVKGNASAINFTLFAQACHQFEDTLNPLRNKVLNLSGNDFLPVTLALEDLFKHTNTVNSLLSKMRKLGASSAHISEMDGTSRGELIPGLVNEWHELKTLTQMLSEKYHKPVELHLQGFRLNIPTQQKKTFKDLAIQLIRNSIVHGIEPADLRRQYGKVFEGQIILTLKKERGTYVLMYKDDGNGVNYEAVRQKLVDKKLLTQREAQSLSEKELLKAIFMEGFSLVDDPNLDAGRGVGMPMLLDKVVSMRGKVNALSKTGKGFVVKITLPERARQMPKRVVMVG